MGGRGRGRRRRRRRRGKGRGKRGRRSTCTRHDTCTPLPSQTPFPSLPFHHRHHPPHTHTHTHLPTHLPSPPAAGRSSPQGSTASLADHPSSLHCTALHPGMHTFTLSHTTHSRLQTAEPPFARPPHLAPSPPAPRTRRGQAGGGGGGGGGRTGPEPRWLAVSSRLHCSPAEGWRRGGAGEGEEEEEEEEEEASPHPPLFLSPSLSLRRSPPTRTAPRLSSEPHTLQAPGEAGASSRARQ